MRSTLSMQRNRCRRVESVFKALKRMIGSPLQRFDVYLKRFFRLAHIARPSFEAGEFLQERQRNFADRTIALFRDNQFRFARFFLARILILLINFLPNEYSD